MNYYELEKKFSFHFFCIMVEKSIPELGFLLHEVEVKYGRRISTSTDFDALSASIQEVTKDSVSSSTLKRLWGYVTLAPLPRTATLDILSRYLGFSSFRDFCDDLVRRDIIESNFFETKCVAVSDLHAGDKVQIGWAPNRLVTLNYLGDFTFEVEESINSKLQQGDRFELSDIILGYPLCISRILRGGEYTPSFIAGRGNGINFLKVN